MNLKRIILKNIRSYKEQEIHFLEGSTLLSGDIGAGKTSVLLGIEFALFGLQPGQRGSSLLRNGETEGGVIIEFEVDGKNIIIERTLKRKKTISQDYCAITLNGEKKEISVTELKDKILDILSYPKEFSKKQNILYKFTVYTPQEEMKQIILQDPITRINTLRHVFGINKYKTILENVSLLTSKLREEKRLKEGATLNLEQEELSLLSKETELETKHSNLNSIEKELFLKKETRKRIQDEKEKIAEKIEEKNKLQQDIEKTKIIISNKKETLDSNLKQIESLKAQIEELQKLSFDESEIKKLEQEIEIKKKQKKQITDENFEITTSINSLEIKNKENEKTKQNLSHLDICPTCLQDVSPVYKSNVINEIDSNISKNIRQINSLKEEKQRLDNKISKLEEEISLLEKKISDLVFLKIKLEGIKEKTKRLEEFEKSNFALQKDITLLLEHEKDVESLIVDLRKFEKNFLDKQKELEDALNQEKMAEIKVAELKKEIDVFSNQIEEIKDRIKSMKEIKKQLDYLTKLENWLNENFASLISFIEKNVMIKLKKEFSKLFSEWFDMLVSDSFNVYLTDDFTPVIEYQDYEIDYAYLSGGERTAVALAYRLALNQVINSILSKIKTKDFIILDEPTDGFSDQQLDKMRDVLQQLNVRQMIIVSHEQKIEGFVENVIRLKKVSGVSKKEY